MIVVQFGTAMMRGDPSSDSGLTSGIVSGTSGSMRKALELSMHTVPFAAASGMNDLDTEAPALTSATSTPRRRSRDSSRTSYGPPRKDTRGARGPRGRERQQLVDGEAALLEGADHLPADGPGGTDDSDLHDAFQPNSGPRADRSSGGDVG